MSGICRKITAKASYRPSWLRSLSVRLSTFQVIVIVMQFVCANKSRAILYILNAFALRSSVDGRYSFRIKSGSSKNVKVKN